METLDVLWWHQVVLWKHQTHQGGIMGGIRWYYGNIRRISIGIMETLDALGGIM